MTISEEVETILKRVGANSKVGEIPSLFAKGHAQDLFGKDYGWGGGALSAGEIVPLNLTPLHASVPA